MTHNNFTAVKTFRDPRGKKWGTKIKKMRKINE